MIEERQQNWWFFQTHMINFHRPGQFAFLCYINTHSILRWVRQPRISYTYIRIIQLTSKLTLVCSNMHVFFYFCQVTQSELACDTRVNLHVDNASSVSCAAWDHLHVLHDCKKHASNTSCAARKSVFLCAAHKLTAILKKNQGIQWNGTLTKRGKTHGHEENSILSSIYVLLLWMTPTEFQTR